MRLVHAELGGYLEAAHGALADVLIANAVLDLVDVPAVLPGLLRLLVPGGVYWFTINYDGESIFEPGHPLRRPGHAGLPPRHGRAHPLRPAGRGQPNGPPPVPLPAGRGGARAGGGVVGLGRVAPARTGTTRPMRLTSCAASLARSRTRCGVARTGWNRRTWPTGWPCAIGNWLQVSWSTSPTSLTSWAARPASARQRPATAACRRSCRSRADIACGAGSPAVPLEGDLERRRTAGRSTR